MPMEDDNLEAGVAVLLHGEDPSSDEDFNDLGEALNGFNSPADDENSLADDFNDVGSPITSGNDSSPLAPLQDHGAGALSLGARPHVGDPAEHQEGFIDAASGRQPSSTR